MVFTYIYSKMYGRVPTYFIRTYIRSGSNGQIRNLSCIDMTCKKLGSKKLLFYFWYFLPSNGIYRGILFYSKFYFNFKIFIKISNLYFSIAVANLYKVQ
jgi:hypothetical protein